MMSKHNKNSKIQKDIKNTIKNTLKKCVEETLATKIGKN